MKPRRFYQYVEKEPHEVSISWKVLHMLIFILICLISMLGAYNFGIIFDIFNYHCILYARPSFGLIDIVYDTTNLTEPAQTEPIVPLVNESAGIEQNGSNPLAIINLLFRAGEYVEERVDRINSGKKVPNTDNYYVINREIYFINETLRGRVKMWMRQTVFATLMMCNLSVFIPLLSVTISSALFVFVMFCGKGGKALSTDPFPGSWLYVYPLLIISVVMSILYAITSSVVTTGLEDFCAGFKKYTGHTSCTRYMNYFTTQQLAGHRHFWQKVVQCHIVFPLGVILWLLQVALTFIRILSVADFNFKMVVIVPKRADWNEEEEEIELESSAATPRIYDVMKKTIQARDTTKVKAV